MIQVGKLVLNHPTGVKEWLMGMLLNCFKETRVMDGQQANIILIVADIHCTSINHEDVSTKCKSGEKTESKFSHISGRIFTPATYFIYSVDLHTLKS